MIDEDRRQCLVYDSDSENAKLVAVEYIISEKLFKGQLLYDTRAEHTQTSPHGLLLKQASSSASHTTSGAPP